MASQKPSIPKGTRDFSPHEMGRRNYIFDTIRNAFDTYGFRPIETPAMENLSTLMGKYGEEGDKLLFKILNSGDYLSGIGPDNIGKLPLHEVTSKLAKRGLRYDLTVPFARYVVQHRNEITFPFRRYQIQPVWRADNPQKGRYREFFQCDADIIGSDALINEFELIQLVDEVFTALKIRTVIKINNRKILAGIAEVIGEEARMVAITVAIDKLEKTGMEQVIRELRDQGLSESALGKLTPVFEMKGTTEEKIAFLESYLNSSSVGLKGIEEIRTLFGYVNAASLSSPVELDITLARGLDYYTGAIIEVKSSDVAIGSICGGGRYDDLTGVFGLPGVSGVGVSFGADRIYDVMMQLDIFPASSVPTTRILFVNFGDREAAHILPMLGRLRARGIPSEIYPDAVKMKKQMTYADQNGIPFVALIGENEISERRITLKDMATGEQQSVNEDQLMERLSG
jgi:histidyl-tRNA synthetase